MGRWGDGEMGRWGDGEVFIKGNYPDIVLMQSLMGETTPVAHGGNPQDRTGSPRPRCIAI
ncbi:hypothetical protein [Moorena sp. SIO4G3]|uniref:hypothetical protein n=1 Tax=Moorena sp. SIO4G3 TaxID=2607821 RepID=UPI001429EEE0|nr:hypothetical protein [Moorena sp. SIO4G3]NEO81130.1 hypothetical protein [Moorena sp. SIO4G3]